MKKLIDSVMKEVGEEQERASCIHGYVNASDHESFAIILEEYDEVVVELEKIDAQLEEFWESIKHNLSESTKIECLRRLSTSAILTACECIQVAAMAQKAILTVKMEK
jgi:hypothetical protein